MLNKTDGKPELSRDHLHETVVLRALDLELHRAVNLGKQRVVTTHADVFAGMELRTALTNNDTAGVDGCITENFHTKTLGSHDRCG